MEKIYEYKDVRKDKEVMKSNVELLKSRNMKSYVFPGNIEERILRIAGEPFQSMRTALFSEIAKDSERMLLELIHCPGGRVIFYTASGTGAMGTVFYT